ncbi:MAG: phenylalanine--tRNA ligase subunit alpha [Candidatus Omnitrophica bacterium]|nr:phenylalanine--tRNA ligase subunit alpha [Candidatus Omnitrophota bacterium]
MDDFKIDEIEKKIDEAFQKVSSLEDLERLRIFYLGRKGVLSKLTGRLPKFSLEERRKMGIQINFLKQRIEDLLQDKEKQLKESLKSTQPIIDMGLPGITQPIGYMHPLTQVIEEICGIFIRMGFSVIEGPEIETEYNNFTALNIALEHPSRDVFDTFYLKVSSSNSKHQKLLLRSHTSPVQIRVMMKEKPPLAIVVPGKVYRPDAVDASHSFMFHQVEGFLVDREVKFSDLKGVLYKFAQSIFGENIKIRFRPHYFPFTEPSAEVDISCIICKGEGCSVCSKKGWLEILGCGMIHPQVLRNVGINPKVWKGFAFGMGVERITMLKYGINDIRLFFDNDLRFLEQF